MERIYVRGSNSDIKTENQLTDLRTVAPDAVVYEDVASGSKKRAHLERLINECRAGDTVWIWSLDRLTREGIHATLDYLKRLTATGARVRSYKESWLDTTSPCYEMIVSCMAFAAKMERDRLIERTVTGIKRARKEKGEPLIDKAKVAKCKGTLVEVAKKFGISHVYVLKIRRQFPQGDWNQAGGTV